MNYLDLYHAYKAGETSGFRVVQDGSSYLLECGMKDGTVDRLEICGRVVKFAAPVEALNAAAGIGIGPENVEREVLVIEQTFGPKSRQALYRARGIDGQCWSPSIQGAILNHARASGVSK